MSGLIFLTTNDFHLENGQKGILLSNKISGFSLVLFYSTQCKYCVKLIPSFRKLPGIISGCQFGMVNISKNKDLIQKASRSITPIEYVPYLILYSNGKPFMRYDGQHDIQSIKNFIMDINNKLKHKRQFSNDAQVKNNKKKIPSYTIGNPLYGVDERSYLEFNDAYTQN